MSTQQVIFESNGSSPLRISASGVDAAGAQFSDLLFDANQSPLRLLQTGSVGVSAIPVGNIAPALVSPVALAKVFPSGKAPLFCCLIRSTYTSDSLMYGKLSTPWRQSQSGAGGAVSNDRFFGINFTAQLPSGIITPYAIHYMIFRNYA